MSTILPFRSQREAAAFDLWVRRRAPGTTLQVGDEAEFVEVRVGVPEGEAWSLLDEFLVEGGCEGAEEREAVLAGRNGGLWE